MVQVDKNEGGIAGMRAQAAAASSELASDGPDDARECGQKGGVLGGAHRRRIRVARRLSGKFGEAETLRAIDAMLNNMGAKALGITEVERLAKVWHDDMTWWGPAGIGATYTIERYDRQHSIPFDKALHTGYRFNGHIAKLAEGSFGGFFGWANLTLQNAGGYMGMTGGGPPADMRVVDMYRAQDGKLAENWIFIDILHYLNMQGLDVLSRMQDVLRGGG